MQNIVFTGRLAADPQISDDHSRALFRLLENRGKDAEGRDRTVGVNCVCWSRGLNEKVIGPGLETGCEVVVVGRFVDNDYTAQDGSRRVAKELVVSQLTVLDWASVREPSQAAA